MRLTGNARWTAWELQRKFTFEAIAASIAVYFGAAMRRRDFIRGITAVSATLPVAAGAQQLFAQPLIGFLSTRSPEEATIHMDAFRRGLEEMAYVEGRNVAVEYRWAKGDYSRLGPLVADLRSRFRSLLLPAIRPHSQPRRRPSLCRLSSSSARIQCAPVWSQVWIGQARPLV
jgi:hypothetical protein